MICYPWGGTVSNNSEGKHIIYHPHSLKCIIERFGVFFFNVWSFYDTTVHKETVSLMAEFQTQNVWKFRDPFCGSGHSMLAFFLSATWVTLFQVKTTTRRWRGGGSSITFWTPISTVISTMSEGTQRCFHSLSSRSADWEAPGTAKRRCHF